MDAHQDVAIGIDFEKVSIECVKHQASVNTHKHKRVNTNTLVLLLVEKKRKAVVNRPCREGRVVDKVEQLLGISNRHKTLYCQVKAQ